MFQGAEIGDLLLHEQVLKDNATGLEEEEGEFLLPLDYRAETEAVWLPKSSVEPTSDEQVGQQVDVVAAYLAATTSHAGSEGPPDGHPGADPYHLEHGSDCEGHLRVLLVGVANAHRDGVAQ